MSITAGFLSLAVIGGLISSFSALARVLGGERYYLTVAKWGLYICIIGVVGLQLGS